MHRSWNVNWYETVFIVKSHYVFKNCVCVRICMYVGMSTHTYVYKCLPKNIWKNTTKLLTIVLMEKSGIRKGSDEGRFSFYYICIYALFFQL